MYSFSEKVVLITGASRGIGAALADAIAAEGANLCLIARDAETLRAVAYDIRSTYGVEVMARACDVRDAVRVETLVKDAYQRFGRLDIIINNAAMLGQITPIHEYDIEQWNATIATNLHGAFYVSRSALQRMREQQEGGRIVFVTSSVARQIRAGWGAYAVSKYAVEGLMQLIALECEKTKVIACSINPGGAATLMRRIAYPKEDPSTLPSPEQVAQAFLKILRLPDKALNGRAFNARDHLG
ncbi:MAG: SDR family NAD(P)-dependent oxidoreductase [Candidatus Hydrogenedentota bacterium]|jgi:NAD(P)-dependent dehydrogenase (short-subunit alcohol dehydrogenase family)|uniref:Dehydrogenases with different specificities (Related to short-chain alcohol dehydrogenases) n=1 Tax=Sumerlaea chitinivorans TaxID=2250252 RepID=A0A2Z4Y8L2_SUMC1|nr:Dehydrogenases with different specificities (related to short-chain alcohol dehydrogenases) [Candidatus Sumerlaea chitinivorans]MCX7963251.1 SDR family NAD(P)-dependent oxidoreductase [Candidatus Sumerlaea chitinivorans]RMH29020.1 MAG: SDR family NAD(P)-dependent oxidoreductase [Candidatus Hydrogenedentota bacterium]GIX44681.1 MAG: oxidoreductase [Candidatus Sumerlaea sp.]